MKPFKLPTSIVCCILFWMSSGFVAASQEVPALDSKSLFYSQPALVNQWSLGDNPAAFYMLPFDNISRIRSGFEHFESNIRRAMDPGKSNALTLQTERIQRVGRVKVHGLFGYQNTHYNNWFYNGTMEYDHTNLYTLGDTIGGRQRKEGYFMQAGIAMPFFNERLLVGVDTDYETTMGAKLRDLRNKNTLSYLNINPGIVYRMPALTIGLNGGPIWANNRTTVSSVLDERQNLFFFRGMGHFVATRNMTGQENAYYEKNGYHGALQIHYTFNAWQLFQQIKYGHIETTSLTGSSYRLIDGITDFTSIQYTGNLKRMSSRFIHDFDLGVTSSKFVGTEVQQETRTRNVQGVWLTYIHTLRWIDNKHIVNDLNAQFSYTFSARGNEKPLRYQLKLSGHAQMYDTGHYPTQNYGFYESTTAGAELEYRHYFSFRNFNLDPVLGGGGRMGISEDHNFISYNNYFGIIPETDFRFFKEDYYTANLGLNISSSRIPLSGLNTAFLNINTRYTVFPDVETDDNTNLSIRVSLGVIF